MIKTDRVAECCRILGVREDVTLVELKKIFHEKAVLYHPDANPSAAAAAEFKNISYAYSILKEHLRKKPSGTARPAPKTRPAPRPRPRRAFDNGASDIASRLSTAELVFRLENSQNRYVRIHAVRALGVQGGNDAVWSIIKTLSDPDPGVRRTATEVLGLLRSRSAVIPLIRLHKKSTDPGAADAVLDSLRLIDSPVAKKFLDNLNEKQAAQEQAFTRHSSDIA